MIRQKQWILCILYGTLSFAAPPSTWYRELISNPDPIRGVITAREVEVPTQAALDLAAWDHNSLMAQPGDTLNPSEAPKKFYSSDVFLERGIFDRLEDTLPGTEISRRELFRPLSFLAVKREAQIKLQWDLLTQLQREFVGLEGVTPTRIYLESPPKKLPWYHKAPGPRIWLQVELQPSVQIKGIHDNDDDGFSELFLRVSNFQGSKDSLYRFYHWVQNEYAANILDSTQILEWAQVLASYWYPSLNTDLVWDLPQTTWPNATVEPHVQKAAAAQTIDHPTLIIRGNPLGKAHYTILKIPGINYLARRQTVSEGQSETKFVKTADRNLPENYVLNMQRLEKERQPYGSYAQWDSTLQPLQQAIEKTFAQTPQNQMALEGAQGWLFFRRSLRFTLGSDISLQDQANNPMPSLIEFKSFLEQNEINMLFVPVPPKTEIYADQLVPVSTDSTLQSLLIHQNHFQLINPWARKFLLDAQDEGMEVMDLWTPFLNHRSQSPTDSLYQKHDTHWTREGMLQTAHILAQRIRHYQWFSELQADSTRFSVRDTVVQRLGDLVERLPVDRQTLYPADALACTQVMDHDSTLYRGKKGSPIVIIGDSFTGVMDQVDCRYGGIGQHLARELGVDVEVITSWGGGPGVKDRFLRARGKALQPIRLVIYLMASRDLYQYPEGWPASP